MDIHSLALNQIGNGTWKMSASVAGQDIWYEIEGTPEKPVFSYDPFVLAGFYLAMNRGESIQVDGDAPVSRELIENLKEAASLSKEWWPSLSGGTVDAERVENRPGPGSEHVGSFFSGGADSLFTYLENANTISHLILCRGLDIADHEPERWAKTRSHVQEFARRHGKAMILVTSNLKKPMRVPGEGDNHGALLASTGMPLGFGTLLIPATNPVYRLQPYGSHPILDPWFSNGRTRVHHDSPVRRSKKMAAIVQTGVGLDLLRVCNREADYNCGTCEKCLRTRAALAILDGESPALEPLADPAELRSLTLQKTIEYDYWMDNLDLAVARRRDDFIPEIERLLKNWRVRETLRQLDADWFGGSLIRLKRRLGRAR